MRVPAREASVQCAPSYATEFRVAPWSYGLCVSWSTTTAQRLLRAAFPWGAHVTVESGTPLLSLRYEVLEVNVGDDTSLLRFERDPGDILQKIHRRQLEAATDTGEF